MGGHSFAVVLTPEPTPTPSVSYAVWQQHAIGGGDDHRQPYTRRGSMASKLKSHYGGFGRIIHRQPWRVFLDRNHVRTVPASGGASSASRFVVSDIRPAALCAFRSSWISKRIAKSSSALRIRCAAVGAGLSAACCGHDLQGHHALWRGMIRFSAGIKSRIPIRRNGTTAAPRTQETSHDVCLVTDGDADRVGAMDGGRLHQ